MNFTANHEQSKEIFALAYHVADHFYRREEQERGANIDDKALHESGENIKQHFPRLDALRVPFWVQNLVICFSEDWRRYRREGIAGYLDKKGVCLEVI